MVSSANIRLFLIYSYLILSDKLGKIYNELKENTFFGGIILYLFYIGYVRRFGPTEAIVAFFSFKYLLAVSRISSALTL